MGAIGGLLGTAGGAAGTGFKAPQSAGVLAPINQSQVQDANTASQNSLASQNALLSALQGQGGLAQQDNAMNANVALQGQLGANNGAGNQAQVFNQGQGLNAQMAANNGAGMQGQAMGQQQGLNQQLAGANGVGTQGSAISGLQNVAAQQQGTADMYRNIANGTGPNPAQAALNQATGQNVANQAALMAGQRGASANVGLLARQAAQQGANTQQQAVGQSATMQANQQIAGLQGMGGAQAAMGNTQQAIGNLGTSQVGAQQAGIGAQASQAGQMVGQQQAQQQLLAGQAQNQVANQMGANQAASNQANVMAGQNIAQTNAGVAAAQNQQNIGMQGLGNYNTNLVNMQGNVNSANAGLAQTDMKGQQDMIGGLMQGVGSAAGLPAGAGGGYVELAVGGDPMMAPYAAPQGAGPVMVPQAAPAPLPGPITQPPPGPRSSFGQFLSGGMNTGSFLGQTPTPDTTQTASAPKPTEGSDLKKGASMMGKAGMAAALAAKGGSVQKDFRAGGHVQASTPGEKAVKPGNSYANDKIKALLSEGEVVIPRDVMESPDPARSAADFVSKVIAKRKRG